MCGRIKAKRRYQQHQVNASYDIGNCQRPFPHPFYNKVKDKPSAEGKEVLEHNRQRHIKDSPELFEVRFWKFEEIVLTVEWLG